MGEGAQRADEGSLLLCIFHFWFSTVELETIALAPENRCKGWSITAVLFADLQIRSVEIRE
jgi:hypothetical protein